jgi:hypothetical protein
MQKEKAMRITALFAAFVLVATAASAQNKPQHYVDADNGVSFDYIAPWRPLDADKDTDYLRPAIQPVRFALVLDTTNPPYAGTDFAGLAFSYVIAFAKTAAACKAVITANGDTAPGIAATVNGRHFDEAQGGDAAMHHQLSERLYSTFLNSRCYVFDLSLATAGFGVSDDVRQMNDAERKDAEESLDDIFGTVKIATLN